VTNAQIVEEVARRKLVEQTVANVMRRPVTHPDCQDLSQMIYQVLLEYDNTILDNCHRRGEIPRLVAHITTRQYWSKTSPFYEQIRRFRESSSPI